MAAPCVHTQASEWCWISTVLGSEIAYGAQATTTGCRHLAISQCMWLGKAIGLPYCPPVASQWIMFSHRECFLNWAGQKACQSGARPGRGPRQKAGVCCCLLILDLASASWLRNAARFQIK